MAVNSITFGNINSADYGIYISGEGVFDAPKRAVEMVSMPGRSGALALDQGYYENITVTYPAFNYEADMSDFKDALSAFRNALASQIGYQRLSDTFHPNEYRLACFSDGLDINPIKYNTAAQFEIKFDCKPQRYLTDGEDEITASSGDDITNPTQYDAHPLLKVRGYGDFTVNGYPITIIGGTFGDTVVAHANNLTGEKQNITNDYLSDVYVEPVMFNEGDYMRIENVGVVATCRVNNSGGYPITYATVSTSRASVSFKPTSDGGGNLTIRYSAPTGAWETGQSSRAIVDQYLAVVLHFSNGTTSTENVRFVVSAGWYESSIDDYEAEAIRIYIRNSTNVIVNSAEFSYSNIIADSSKVAYGVPTYIDCDTGEAYMITANGTVSLNKYVALGSDLPVLSPGANKVRFSSPITQVKIVPRWFKL